MLHVQPSSSIRFIVCNYIHGDIDNNKTTFNIVLLLLCACVSEIKQSVCLLAILSSCQYVSLFVNPL